MDKNLKLKHDIEIKRSNLCYNEAKLSDFVLNETNNCYEFNCACGDLYEVSEIFDKNTQSF